MLLHLCKGLTRGTMAHMYYEIRVPTPALSGSGPLGMISARITPDTPANCYFTANINTFIHKNRHFHGKYIKTLILSTKGSTFMGKDKTLTLSTKTSTFMDKRGK